MTKQQLAYNLQQMRHQRELDMDSRFHFWCGVGCGCLAATLFWAAVAI